MITDEADRLTLSGISGDTKQGPAGNDHGHGQSAEQLANFGCIQRPGTLQGC